MSWIINETLYFVIMICLPSGFICQTIDPKPANTHVMAGGNTTFSCTIQDIRFGTMWDKTDNGIDAISFDDALAVPFTDEKYEIEGTYNLKIVNAVLGDAGNYRCQYFIGRNVYFKAQLVVLESDPVCSTNISDGNIAIEGEFIEYTCQINYAGKWAPAMTWRDNSGSLIPSIDSGVNGSSVMHAVVIRVTPADDTRSFSCETNFGLLDPAPGDKEASNIPSYYYEYESDPITVHFPPRNTRIEPDEPTIHVGETLTCLSDANPAVTTWEWFNLWDPYAGPLWTEQIIIVQESWVDQTVILSCKVTNLMRDNTPGEDTVDILLERTSTITTTTTATTNTMTTAMPTTDIAASIKDDFGLSAGALAGIIAAIIIITMIVTTITIFGIFYLIRHRQSRVTGNTSETENAYELKTVGNAANTSPTVYDELFQGGYEIPDVTANNEEATSDGYEVPRRGGNAANHGYENTA